MDGADGGDMMIAIELANEQFADLPRAPMRLVLFWSRRAGVQSALEADRIANRSPRPVAQGDGSFLPIAIENLVSGLS
jgi:hypothetical protein